VPPSKTSEDWPEQAIVWAYRWCHRHPLATLRIVAVAALAAALVWLIVVPGAPGLLATVGALSGVYAVFRLMRHQKLLSPESVAPSAPGDVGPVLVAEHQPPAGPPPPVESLLAVEVGETRPLDAAEPVKPWTLQIWQSHWCVVGITRSGKSGLLRAMLQGLAPSIHAGVVVVWAVDPKRGAELGAALPLFSRFDAVTEDDLKEEGAGAADLLDDAYRWMARRYAEMAAAGVDIHTPTVTAPMLVVLVDEVAQIATVQTKAIRDRINGTLTRLVRQGAAAAVVVIVATQDPRKEVVDMRQFIPGRVCFRVLDAQQPDLALGPGARARGAKCDEISKDDRGIAFTMIDGDAYPTRVRAKWVDKKQLEILARDYASPTRVRT
jgi:S-DNA-T family DNA segregation ATPase FtsK/SpoIIIE